MVGNSDTITANFSVLAHLYGLNLEPASVHQISQYTRVSEMCTSRVRMFLKILKRQEI